MPNFMTVFPFGCFNEGMFFDDWKVSNVVTARTKHNKQVVNNYHSVSLVDTV